MSEVRRMPMQFNRLLKNGFNILLSRIEHTNFNV